MKYILKWILLFIITSILVFTIVRLIPTSPVDMLLQSYNLPLSEHNRSILIKDFGLDKNIYTQYFKWITNILKGNLGISFITKVPVKSEFISRLPYSISIGLSSLIIAIFSSYFLGYFAAIKEYGFINKLTRFISIVSSSVPSFIWTIFIIYYLGVKIKIIKFFSTNNFWAIFFSIIILSLYQIGFLSRIVRKAFVELKEESFVQFYLLRGFKLEYILFRHCYKPVLYSLLSASISRFSTVIGGSAIIEYAFAIPGVSYFLISSIIARDYNIIQAYILFLFIWMAFIHSIFNIFLFFLKEKSTK